MHAATLGLTQVHSSAESGGQVTETAYSFFPVFGEVFGKATHWLMDLTEKYGGPQGYIPEGPEALVGINPCNPPKDVKGEPPYSALQREQWKQQCVVQKMEYAAFLQRKNAIDSQKQLLAATATETWYTQKKYYFYAAGGLLAVALAIRFIRRS